jgi:hypothetical protein
MLIVEKGVSMEHETIYMQYICKGRKCRRIFLAEDLYDRDEPEEWRYCPECEAKHKPKIRKDPYEGTNHRIEIYNKKSLHMKNISKRNK